MYQQGDLVVYGVHGVSRIIGSEIRTVDRKKVEYFVLELLDQPGARFYVPTQNQAALAKLRPVLDANGLTALLHSEEARRDSWIPDEGQRKLRYRELINSGDRAALLSMVGSLHRHKNAVAAQGKKFHLCDENFLRDAEKLLHSEFSMVLGIEPGKVGQYIKNSLLGEAACMPVKDKSSCETEQNESVNEN